MVLLILLLVGGGGWIVESLLLEPSLVLDRLQLWRLISYPLAAAAWSLLLGALAFGEPGEAVESTLGRRRFALLLGAVVLGSGLLHLLLFAGSGVVLAGMTNPAVAVAVGFLYLYPFGQAKILFVHVSRVLLGGLILLIAAVLLALAVGAGGEPLLLLSGGGGSALLSLLWFHLTFQKYPVLPTLTARLAPLVGGGREASPSGYIPEMERGMTRERQGPTRAQRADALLEKIAAHGIDSLSDEERAFLDDFAKRM